MITCGAPSSVADTGRGKTPRAAPAPRPAEVRMKLFWGVFNQSLKRVALFEYDEKKQADEKAKKRAYSELM